MLVVGVGCSTYIVNSEDEVDGERGARDGDGKTIHALTHHRFNSDLLGPDLATSNGSRRT